MAKERNMRVPTGLVDTLNAVAVAITESVLDGKQVTAGDIEQVCLRHNLDSKYIHQALEALKASGELDQGKLFLTARQLMAKEKGIKEADIPEGQLVLNPA